MNIVEPIIFQAKINPNSIAICTPGTRMDFVTYAGLARIIDSLGRVALSLGLARGDIVAIYVSETIFHAALVLALTRLGIVTVSARTPRLPKELGVKAVIASKTEAFENAGKVILADPNWMFTDGAPLTRDQIAAQRRCRRLPDHAHVRHHRRSEGDPLHPWWRPGQERAQ